ncbi:hypothetical protein KC853_01820 [Candidatus Saccharibacteria bacterium]|nr:hypothetical protein [Candidatus Saccharibacteria bacterium]MCB9834942.1 hypothetical protein [Candidatus Nomurabacteria bacterium]
MKPRQIDNLSGTKKLSSKSIMSSYRKPKPKQPQPKVSSKKDQITKSTPRLSEDTDNTQENLTPKNLTSKSATNTKIANQAPVDSNFSLSLLKHQIINLAPNLSLKSKPTKNIFSFKLDQSFKTVVLLNWLKTLTWLTPYLIWIIISIFKNNNKSIFTSLASTDLSDFYLTITSAMIVLIWITHILDNLIALHETRLVSHWQNKDSDINQIFINYRSKLDLRQVGFLVLLFAISINGLFIFRPVSGSSQALTSIIFSLTLFITLGYHILSMIWIDQKRFGYQLNKQAIPSRLSYQGSIAKSILYLVQIAMIGLMILGLTYASRIPNILILIITLITSLIISLTVKATDQLINFTLLTSYLYKPIKSNNNPNWHQYFKTKLIFCICLSISLIGLSWIFDSPVVSILSRFQEILTTLLDRASQ